MARGSLDVVVVVLTGDLLAARPNVAYFSQGFVSEVFLLTRALQCWGEDNCVTYALPPTLEGARRKQEPKTF